jgi:hypothetical protein
MDLKEEQEALQKECANLEESSAYSYGKPIDEVTSGRLRGLTFRIRELSVQRYLEEDGIKRIPQSAAVQFSDAEVIASIRRINVNAEWHVCRCGKCKYAFGGHGEDAFEAERLIGAMFRYIKAQPVKDST